MQAHPEMGKVDTQRLIDQEEGGAARMGAGGNALASLAVGTSLFHLYAAYEAVPATVLRVVHVALVLTLCFLIFPCAGRVRGRLQWWDWLTVVASLGGAAYLLAGHGYYFLPLAAVVMLRLSGYSPIMAVFWATVVAFLASFANPTLRLGPRRPAQALAAGSTGVVNVAVTCAAAGIIVGVVTLTGLGLKFSSIVVAYAGGNLLLTALLTALVVWVVGLAVPVTASYIICAVIAAPALTAVGVPDFAAHMFIFYYAVLSEVLPPTALLPFAAAAITGADPYRTTLQSWKYTLPAFVVPFMFVLHPAGIGLLLKGAPGETAFTVITAVLGVAALAAGVQNRLRSVLLPVERMTLIGAGILLAYPGHWSDAAGLVQ